MIDVNTAELDLVWRTQLSGVFFEYEREVECQKAFMLFFYAESDETKPTSSFITNLKRQQEIDRGHFLSGPFKIKSGN